MTQSGRIAVSGAVLGLSVVLLHYEPRLGLLVVATFSVAVAGALVAKDRQAERERLEKEIDPFVLARMTPAQRLRRAVRDAVRRPR